MADTGHGQEIQTLSTQIARMQERIEVIITALDVQARDRAATQAAIDRMMRDVSTRVDTRRHLTLVKP